MIEVNEEKLYQILYHLFGNDIFTCGCSCPIWEECDTKRTPCMTDKKCVELTIEYLRGC